MDKKLVASELIKIAKSLVAIDSPEDVAADVVSRMTEKNMTFKDALKDIGHGSLWSKTRESDLPDNYEKLGTKEKTKFFTKYLSKIM